MAEIDAPELRQPFGHRSRQSLAELCFQESAKVELIARDGYGRAVGKVECAGKDASSHQVSTGMAWVYNALRAEEFAALWDAGRGQSCKTRILAGRRHNSAMGVEKAVIQ